MDDRRFDQLVKAVASGASRRTVLKGMLGLGGAALVGGTALEPDADAARRPTPTPRTPTCPGNQIPSGGQCICPGTAPEKCGPDCCTKGSIPAGNPGYSECCDQACCFGTCYGEELCCPTNARAGGLPPLADFCLETGECCLAPDFCCNIDGCCSTVCYGGNFDDDFCCPVEDFCPGGGTSPDLCCTNDTTCCGSGTDDNVCVDLNNGGCCAVSDCGPVEAGACAWACDDNECVSIVCSEGTICCQGECVSSSDFSACPVDPAECCSSEDGFICCGSGGCCLGSRCNEVNGDCCATEEAVCRVEGGCCTPPQECCLGETCCDPGKCAASGCCTGNDIVCGAGCCPADQCSVNPATGIASCCPVGSIACSGGICCAADKYQCASDGPGCECLPGTEPCSLLPGGCCPVGQCNDDFFCCPAGTTACGTDCCDNATETCNAQGICVCANGGVLCNGVCTQGQCCAGESPDRCATVFGYDLECVTCPSGFCDNTTLNGTPCGTDDTDVTGVCTDGFCVPCGGPSAPCTLDEDCCSGVCLDEGTCTDP